ncbi:D-galactarolactone cycloisomerase [Bosea sp. OK403]|uniref:mandelate racemase/muconate lactonizing enzyme family protein n=1 Tax=Bosea sp. OK403 TaxID=1855286 RepID=UPI0008E07E70|nr:mandelate racemase/muconate lactonizing enzyme family protein [Bosea sp. OK403]SFJ77650.1 D-galactarolactone cycloisomerase [Bosea sp. OK403]
MKITEIRGHHVGFAPSPAIGNARTMIRRRDFLLLEIVTDTGKSGWGEVFSSPDAAAALIRMRYAPLVLGQSPARYRALWEQMAGNLGYDRRGPAMMAISAIDMALCDLAAQDLGVSVAAMLGGALREQVFAYGSGPFIVETRDPFAHYATEVERCLAQGYRAVKPRAGVSPRADGAMLASLRRQVGPEIALMVDINQAYSARAAIASARLMEASDLLWIEEPVEPDDIPGYAAVAAAVTTAVAGGEALASAAAFRDFLVAGTLSILQPDLTVCGGYTGFLRIAALAAAFDLPIMPHVFGTIVNHQAALQIAGLLPARRGGGPASYPYVEVDVSTNPLLALQGAVKPNADGTLDIPDRPGTGLDLTAERLEPWRRESWICR